MQSWKFQVNWWKKKETERDNSDPEKIDEYVLSHVVNLVSYILLCVFNSEYK